MYMLFEHRLYGEEIMRDSDGDYLYTEEEHEEKDFINSFYTYEDAVHAGNQRLNSINGLPNKPIKLEYKQSQYNDNLYISNRIFDNYNCYHSIQILKTEML